MYDDPTPAGPNVLAIVSLVLGIVTILSTGCCCIPIVSMGEFLLLPILVIAAWITGILGFLRAEQAGGKGFAIGGMALSAVGVIVAVLLYLFTMGVAFIPMILDSM